MTNRAQPESFFVKACNVVSIKMLLVVAFCLASSFSHATETQVELPQLQWKLISVPANLPASENSLDQVIGDDIAAVNSFAIYGTDWIVYSFQEGALRVYDYEEVGLDEPLDGA